MSRLKTLPSRLKALAPRLGGPQANRQATRQYATNSTIWRRLRAQVLAEEPLCRLCAPKVTAATVVDHIDGDSWNNARSNLQPLCASCHGIKTARDDGGFGNPRQG